MAKYKLVGSQNPTDRIDRWKVENASDEYPDGKFLELGGPAVELTPQQFEIGSRFLRLEIADDEDKVTSAPLVDQPGVNSPSLSTDNPPDPGTAPDLAGMNKTELEAEIGRVRRSDPSAMPGVTDKTKAEDMRDALRDYHGAGA